MLLVEQRYLLLTSLLLTGCLLASAAPNGNFESESSGGSEYGAPAGISHSEEHHEPGLHGPVAGIANILAGGGKKHEHHKENEIVKKDDGIFGGFKGLNELVKLIFNPVEFCKAIAKHFKLDLEKFFDVVGRGLIFGVEAILQPLVITLKITEKVFVPDSCRLRFLCKMGTHLEFIREHVLKFSTNFLEGSSQIKAFSDGIIGKDCDTAFHCGEGGPKLKKQYEELKKDHDYHQGDNNEHQYDSASSNTKINKAAAPATAVRKAN